LMPMHARAVEKTGNNQKAGLSVVTLERGSDGRERAR
jgi:hypothetical protein